MSPLFQAGNVASIIGLLFAVFSMKWVARVLNSFGLTSIEAGVTPDRAGRVAGSAALLLHPAPWILLGGAVYLTHWAMAEQDASTRVVVVSWSIGTYVVIVGFAIWAVVRQSKRRKASGAKN